NPEITLMPLSTLPEIPTRRRLSDCRVHRRIPCAVPVSCQPTSLPGSGESRRHALIQNISLGGVSLVVGQRFECGTWLAIDLPGTESRQSFTLIAKVVHSQPKGNDLWALGCQFVTDLSDLEMKRLFPWL